jgi:hypothetical protein
MTKLNEFLEQNQDYKIYIVNRLIDDINIQTICDELNSFETNINFTIDDLINYKNSCDLSCKINSANDNKNNNDNEAVKFSVNFDDDLKLFKIKNLIEQNNHCNELLSEINYKLLYIINEKLNRYQDRVPKDDIQAFKIINEMVYKPEIENVLSSNIVMNYDAKRYGNELINKLLQSKYLTREDTLNLIKFMFKDGYDKGFKGKHELLDD